MKKPDWQSKHFKSIFRTVYVTSVALLTIAMLILYIAFQEISVSYLDSAMIRFMENTYSSIEYQIAASQNHALNASTSYNGIILFSTQPGFQNEKLRAAKEVDYFITQDANIHSVLFYNSSSGRLCMFGRDLVSGSADTFYDQDAVSRIQSSNLSKCIPRTICNSPYNSSVSKVLTSIHYIGNGNYVVTNLDVEHVFSVLRSDRSVYSKGSISYIVLYDRSQVIYDGFSQDDTAAQQEAIVEALRAHQWKDSFNARLDHVNYHFQIMEDPQNNLQMVSIARQYDVMAGFLAYLISLLCIIALGGIVAVLVNLRVSSKLYSPIVRIRHTLTGKEEAPDTLPDDEIDDITRRIADRSTRLESLFSYKKKRLSLEILLKNQMLDDYFLALHNYTPETAGASVSVFASRLISMFKRIEATCPSFPPINYHQFYIQLSTVHTLAQARDLICGQILDVIQVLGQENHNSAGIDARDVQSYLENNYQDIALSSKSVAMTFHVSVPYLNRIFKQKTGESISSYLKKLRLEHARTLLLDTGKPVEVIARSVGFENTKYFYSLFKAEYGISPNSYRTSGKKTPEQEAGK